MFFRAATPSLLFLFSLVPQISRLFPFYTEILSPAGLEVSLVAPLPSSPPRFFCVPGDVSFPLIDLLLDVSPSFFSSIFLCSVILVLFLFFDGGGICGL